MLRSCLHLDNSSTDSSVSSSSFNPEGGTVLDMIYKVHGSKHINGFYQLGIRIQNMMVIVWTGQLYNINGGVHCYGFSVV